MKQEDPKYMMEEIFSWKNRHWFIYPLISVLCIALGAQMQEERQRDYFKQDAELRIIDKSSISLKIPVFKDRKYCEVKGHEYLFNIVDPNTYKTSGIENKLKN